jgi:hypothetical protein
MNFHRSFKGPSPAPGVYSIGPLVSGANDPLPKRMKAAGLIALAIFLSLPASAQVGEQGTGATQFRGEIKQSFPYPVPKPEAQRQVEATATEGAVVALPALMMIGSPFRIKDAVDERDRGRGIGPLDDGHRIYQLTIVPAHRVTSARIPERNLPNAFLPRPVGDGPAWRHESPPRKDNQL